MAYSTATIIQNLVLDEDTLINLTDDKDIGKIDQAKVTAAIKRADAEIDKHLSAIYEVPLSSPVPGLVEGWSAELAAYHLHRSRTRSTEIVDDYNKVMSNLKAVAAGNLPVPGLEGLSGGAGVPGSTTDGRGVVFKRNVLDEDGDIEEVGTMEDW